MLMWRLKLINFLCHVTCLCRHPHVDLHCRPIFKNFRNTFSTGRQITTLSLINGGCLKQKTYKAEIIKDAYASSIISVQGLKRDAETEPVSIGYMEYSVASTEPFTKDPGFVIMLYFKVFIHMLLAMATCTLVHACKSKMFFNNSQQFSIAILLYITIV